MTDFMDKLKIRIDQHRVFSKLSVSPKSNRPNPFRELAMLACLTETGADATMPPPFFRGYFIELCPGFDRESAISSV